MTNRRYGLLGYRPARTAVAFKATPPVTVDHVPCKTTAIAIRDQLQEGACGGFGTSRILQAVLGLPYPLSPQFSYWNGKLHAGMQLVDSGVFIPDVLEAAADYGICPESSYPYVEGEFNKKPPTDAYVEAMPIKGRFKFEPLPRSSQAVLAALTRPNTLVIDGMSVFSYFESDQMAKDGLLRLPQRGEAFLGGHCTITSGFDLRCVDAPFAYLLRDNSWSDKWGIAGRYKMPLSYIDDPRGLVGDIFAVSPV